MNRQRVGVRAAVHPDIPSIQRIARLAWAGAYQGIIPPEIQEQAIATWYAPAALAGALRTPASTFLVAETGKTVVGFVNIWIDSAEIVRLARIYILPSEQRKGIGTQLLNQAFAAVQSTVRTAAVEVEERNDPARAFYEWYGFAPIGPKIAKIFGFELPIVRYEKTLTTGAS